MQVEKNRHAIITQNSYVTRDDVIFAYAGSIVNIDVMANDDRPADAVFTLLDDKDLSVLKPDGTVDYDLTGYVYDPDYEYDRIASFKYAYEDDFNFVFPVVTINVLWGTPGLGGSPHQYTDGYVKSDQTNYSFSAIDYIDPGRTGTTLELASATLDGVAFEADLAADGTISFDPSQFHFLRYSIFEKKFEFEVIATNDQGQSATNYLAVDIGQSKFSGEEFSTTFSDNMSVGGDGNDTLYGTNGGSDILFGGKGGDNFYFSESVNDGLIASDVVLDYDVVGDTIHFDKPTEIVSMIEVYDGLIIVHDGGSDMLFINGDGITRENADIQNVYVPGPPSGGSSSNPSIDDILLADLLYYGDPFNWALFNPQLPFVSYW